MSEQDNNTRSSTSSSTTEGNHIQQNQTKPPPPPPPTTTTTTTMVEYRDSLKRKYVNPSLYGYTKKGGLKWSEEVSFFGEWFIFFAIGLGEKLEV